MIGRGRWRVYGAIHPLIGKRVAIKVLHHQFTHQPVTVQRFLLEARAANRIGHPNIVDIFAFGVLPDRRHYFVMEWLDGETLADRIDRDVVPRTEAYTILDEILAGLQDAHAKDIVHRDLKPDNIFLLAGDRVRVKLLDFGIAKLVGNNLTSKTQTGNFIGSPHYVSPEQARGQAVDGRADIYSLGAVAYEVLSGAPPFNAPSIMDVVAMHLHDPPADLASRAPVPAEVAATVMSMLAKSPDERPSIAAIREVLELVYLREVAPDATILDTTSGQVVRLSGSLAAVRITGQMAVVPAGRGTTGQVPRFTPEPPVADAPIADAPVAVRADTAPADAPVAEAPAPARRRWPWIAAAAGIAGAAVLGLGLGRHQERAAATTAAEAPPASAPAPVTPTPPPPAAPAPAEPAHLALTVRGSAPGLRVTIDGERRAVDADQRAVVELTPGPHTIVVTARGRGDERRELDLAAGVVEQLEITMVRDRPTRDRPPRRRGPRDDDGVVDPFAGP
ncbi:MAG: serine/threonine protein kinase [Myxococcales bacterium]|nr:serine/threonine protein kinase [Myxococcales bacterium]